MKIENILKSGKAFTLIELLVVVLIIGILVAIAVPKYMTAIGVSRVRTGISIAREVWQAQRFYYLSNGKYTKEISDLYVDTGYTKATDNGTSKDYTHKWGGVRIYNYQAMCVLSINTKPITIIDYFGPNYFKNGAYARCYNNNNICSKFGGKIQTPAKQHSSKTNVYYMTVP